MSFEAFLEGLGEEVFGSLCGLPPGAITAAKAAGLLVSKASDTSDASSHRSPKATVDRNSKGLSRKEKRVVEIAVKKLAIQIKRDHPRLHPAACEKAALSVLVLNNKLYKPAAASKHFEIALVGEPALRRNVIVRILRDGRRYLR